MTSPGPSARVRRPVVVLTALGLFGALFAAATRTWVRAGLASPVGGSSVIEVAGSQAAPAATACALAGLAAAAAMSIAGRRTVWLVAGVCALAAAGAGWGAVGVLLDPTLAARAQVAQALAVTPESVGSGTADVTSTSWVWAALVLSAAALVTALVGLVAARTWSHGARFAVPPAPTVTGAGDDDAGTADRADPADGADRGATADSATTADRAATADAADRADRADQADAAASWDALTRGVDPTRTATTTRAAAPAGGGGAGPGADPGAVHRDSDAAGGRMDPPGHTDGGTTHA